MKFINLFRITALTAGLCLTAGAFAAEEPKPVGITAELMGITVKHNGQDIEIKREQDNNATINPLFAKTSRPCPPFCIQPDKVAPGVDTIAELGVLDYLQKMSAGDTSILVIDSRTPDFVERGMIPGAKNISWKALSPKEGATTEGIIEILTNEFGAKLAADADAFAVDEAVTAGGDAVGKIFDYSGAKTLVMYCNGLWCGQSPANIKTLLSFGYPADKIKWYRGGMQDWEVLGLTTVPGAKASETAAAPATPAAAAPAPAPAPATEAKPVEAKPADAKTDAKPADAKPEAKPEAKADSPKADTPKADSPKAEDKPAKAKTDAKADSTKTDAKPAEGDKTKP
ncbi:MAG: rhodanese-like domain-containing protein [Thiothrix sp.]|uniref:rhodanese-like domain-containing protein n=1 Tax=Thiothrix sp. TaxID=1032 RepID=UPI00262087D2|nr:rhodanese-like domain-containing protein [Thiothrix sp.]MDD5393128.1 rhodanese-like domain-containing protein [Thiothrix sp.]